MGPIEQLTTILPTVCDVVDRIEAGQLTAATPCDEFTVHDVLDHMIVLGGSFAHLFRGDVPPAQAAPPVYGRVPAAEFRAAMDALLAAVRSEGAMARTLQTPLGEMDAETFARVVAVDGLVHGWDLAGRDRAAVWRRRGRGGCGASLRRGRTHRRPPRDGHVRRCHRGAGRRQHAIERLVSFSGRTTGGRWRGPAPIHLDKGALPRRIDAPGAVARQMAGFGDVSAYATLAGEYFSLAAGTDIAPLLKGLDHDSCHRAALGVHAGRHGRGVVRRRLGRDLPGGGDLLLASTPPVRSRRCRRRSAPVQPGGGARRGPRPHGCGDGAVLSDRVRVAGRNQPLWRKVRCRRPRRPSGVVGLLPGVAVLVHRPVRITVGHPLAGIAELALGVLDVLAIAPSADGVVDRRDDDPVDEADRAARSRRRH